MECTEANHPTFGVFSSGQALRIRLSLKQPPRSCEFGNRVSDLDGGICRPPAKRIPP